jgi:hypothetical protein
VAANPFTNVVSSDGKTMTTTMKGTNAQGRQVSNITVWDRVQ